MEEALKRYYLGEDIKDFEKWIKDTIYTSLEKIFTFSSFFSSISIQYVNERYAVRVIDEEDEVNNIPFYKYNLEHGLKKVKMRKEM